MTDEEIICTWMEPLPGFRGINYPKSVAGWWTAPNGQAKTPTTLDLDALHEVEAQLTEELWEKYEIALWAEITPNERIYDREWIHATASDKIKALAAILKYEVENKGQRK